MTQANDERAARKEYIRRRQKTVFSIVGAVMVVAMVVSLLFFFHVGGLGNVKYGVNQAYTVASNFTDAMLVMDDRQDQLIDVIVGATFDNLQDAKKVPAAGKAITGIQGCVAVDKMTDLPKAPEHDAVNPQS